ncbi:hypothetical protein ASD98_21960 [Flavobacterium sp. Root186]|nr:hypothetical protein ASD98_21960 [Flavobacterium sp. Root186]
MTWIVQNIKGTNYVKSFKISAKILLIVKSNVKLFFYLFFIVFFKSDYMIKIILFFIIIF